MFTPSGRFQPDRKICFSMSDFHPGSWNPAWSVATILTGLLSFMLSDELTTGSVTSTEYHKRAFAARSHSWNLTQPRFKDAFPEHCLPALQDLPNMGEKERGKPATISLEASVPASSSTSSMSIGSMSNHTPSFTGKALVNSSVVANVKPEDPRQVAPPAPGWQTTWRHFIYEKWRLCAFIALAVVVSRFSARGWIMSSTKFCLYFLLIPLPLVASLCVHCPHCVAPTKTVYFHSNPSLRLTSSNEFRSLRINHTSFFHRLTTVIWLGPDLMFK